VPRAVRRHFRQLQAPDERLPDLHAIVRIEQRSAAGLPRLGPGLAFAARREDAEQIGSFTFGKLA
jgi:hypothetical protein